MFYIFNLFVIVITCNIIDMINFVLFLLPYIMGHSSG